MPKGYPTETKPRTPAQILQQQFFLDLGNIKMMQGRLQHYSMTIAVGGSWCAKNYLDNVEARIRDDYALAKAKLPKKG